MEKISDPKKLKALEEKRIDLHWSFMEALKKNEIRFKDRDHATRIAFEMTREQ